MTTQLSGRDLNNREFFIRRWEQEYPSFVAVLRALPAEKLDYRRMAGVTQSLHGVLALEDAGAPGR